MEKSQWAFVRGTRVLIASRLAYINMPSLQLSIQHSLLRYLYGFVTLWALECPSHFVFHTRKFYHVSNLLLFWECVWISVSKTHDVSLWSDSEVAPPVHLAQQMFISVWMRLSALLRWNLTKVNEKIRSLHFVFSSGNSGFISHNCEMGGLWISWLSVQQASPTHASGRMEILTKIKDYYNGFYKNGLFMKKVSKQDEREFSYNIGLTILLNIHNTFANNALTSTHNTNKH